MKPFPFLPLFLGVLIGGAAGAAVGVELARRETARAGADATKAPPRGMDGEWAASLPGGWLSHEEAWAAAAGWLTGRAEDGSELAEARRAEELRALLAALATEDLSYLLEPLAAREGDEEQGLFQIAFDVWCERAPEAAARWAGGRPRGVKRNRERFCQQAGREWAKRDPMAAAVWATALADEELAARVAPELIARFAAQNQERALTLADSRGKAFEQAVYPAIMNELAKTDPAAAMRLFGARVWRDGGGAHDMIPTLGAWLSRDAGAALAWMSAQPVASDQMLGDILGAAQVYGDRRKLLDALVTTEDFPARQSALGNLFARWGVEKPEEALAWLDQLSDPHLRNVLLERAARGTSPDRVPQSLALALRMSDGRNRDDRVRHLLSTWAKRDLPATLAWMAASADPTVRRAAPGVQAATLAEIAIDEPETAAATWATLTDAEARHAAVMPIAAAWARSDPAAAMHWLDEREAANAAELMTGGVFDDVFLAWASRDGLAALRWAEARPEPALQKRALRALAGQHRPEQPERAALAGLYAQVVDPERRAEMLESHLKEWLVKDAAGARAWIEANRASAPELATRLLTQP